MKNCERKVINYECMKFSIGNRKKINLFLCAHPVNWFHPSTVQENCMSWVYTLQYHSTPSSLKGGTAFWKVCYTEVKSWDFVSCLPRQGHKWFMAAPPPPSFRAVGCLVSGLASGSLTVRSPSLALSLSLFAAKGLVKLLTELRNNVLALTSTCISNYQLSHVKSLVVFLKLATTYSPGRQVSSSAFIHTCIACKVDKQMQFYGNSYPWIA